MSVLVTGAAGFIGFHVAGELAARGEEVLGVDNLNHAYSPDLKKARLRQLTRHPNFTFYCIDIADADRLENSLRGKDVTAVIHLAAQAGIRDSDPRAHARDNIMGQVEVLEFCRKRSVAHLVHASTGAVYGANAEVPHQETSRVDDPLSVYAATKRGGELLARTWSALHDLPVTSLRFFTIYGPWGRPDMAAWRFADAILGGRPIQVHGHGRMRRSFTYIDDLVGGIVAAVACRPGVDQLGFRHATYNLGDPVSTDLGRFISILETALGRTAIRELVDRAPGEVEISAAHVEAARQALGFRIQVPIEEGLRRFADWFVQYRTTSVAS